MKEQDSNYIKARDKVRQAVYMRRLNISGQNYRKNMGLPVNGKRDRALTDSEVNELSKAIDDTMQTLKDFKDVLHS